MRKGIDYIGVTVCFYCYDSKGNLLLQKRSKHCRDEQGTWDCGGGAVEFGETFEEAAIRELKEEYNCTPKKLTFCGVNNVLRTHNNIKTHWVCLIFAAYINPQDVSIGDSKKIEESQWFNIHNLPKPLHSMYLAHLEMVKKNYIMNDAMLKKLDALVVLVKNISATTEFYKQLGFEVVEERKDKVGVELNGFFIDFHDETTIEIDDESGKEPKGLGIYIYINVDHIDDYHASLIKKGLKPSSEPKDWPWGNREFAIRDPDGYKLVFYTELNK